MISFTSQATGTTLRLDKGSFLGRGEYGDTYELCRNGCSAGLVCKEITISLGNQRKSWVTRKARLQSVINELKYLTKLNLLEGYRRERNTFFIIMKKMEGKVADESSLDHDDRIFACYKELKNLHRKNIAHMDCHFGNFIISERFPFQAQAIDFGSSKEATYLNSVMDFYALCYHEKAIFSTLVKYYVVDMVTYAWSHKFETVQNLLMMGAVTLAAIYGIPVLMISHLMVQEFLLALLIHQLGKEISSAGLNTLIGELIFKKTHLSPQTVMKITDVLYIAQSCLSFYLMHCNLIYHWAQSGPFINQTLALITNRSWKAIFSNLSLPALTHTALMYYPISLMMNVLEDISQKHLLPECLLKAKTDLMYSYLPRLGAKSGSFANESANPILSQSPKTKIS